MNLRQAWATQQDSLGKKKAGVKTQQLRALAVSERTHCGSQLPVTPAQGIQCSLWAFEHQACV